MQNAFDLRESRFGWSWPLLLGAHLLATTWFSGVVWQDAALDGAFLVAISLALLGGLERGAWMGLGAGFLAALVADWHPGSYFVARLIPCLLIGFLAPRIAVFHPLAPPMCAILAAFCADLVFVVISPTAAPLGYWISHALGFALLQMLFIWPVFWICARVVRPRRKLVFG